MTTADSVAQTIDREINDAAKDMQYYLAEYTLEYYADKLESGELVIPAYQRNYVWDNSRASRFIESVLLNIPVPYVFLSQNDEGILEIVDGSQRLRTIAKYFSDELVLGEIELVPSLSDTKFSQLSVPRQRKIRNTTLRAVILTGSTDEALAQLFDRINTGSMKASPADIRRGSAVGKFQNLVQELATENETFLQLAPLTDREKAARKNEELVARFFAFQGDLESYRDRVADFIAEFTEHQNSHATQAQLEEMRQQFSETMEFVNEVFPYGFRRNEQGQSTPNTRFDAIAIGSRRALDQGLDAAPSKDTVREFLDSEVFRLAIRADGANAKSKLQRRIAVVSDFLLTGTLEGM